METGDAPRLMTTGAAAHIERAQVVGIQLVSKELRVGKVRQTKRAVRRHADYLLRQELVGNQENSFFDSSHGIGLTQPGAKAFAKLRFRKQALGVGSIF